MKNELMVFEGNNVEVLELDGKILFNPKDVAKCLDILDVNSSIRDFNENQVVKLTNSKITESDFRKLNNAGENFLTEEGLSLLLSRTIKLSNDKKRDFIATLNEQGFNLNLIALTRKEIEFLDLLEGVLEPFNYICYRQYNVNGKRIDFYIEDLNIVIEYDENDHKSYSYEDQEKRQNMIESELGCSFIRLSDKESNAYNVGLVMKGMVN